MEDISLLDLHGVDRKYSFEIISKTAKKGKNEFTQKWLIFHTIGEDDLRFIEDIAEEICKKKNLPLTTTRFFEKNSKNQWWSIDTKWDSGRFRGTCFIELENDPTVEKIIEKEINNI
jgi:hypothetical protein